MCSRSRKARIDNTRLEQFQDKDGCLGGVEGMIGNRDMTATFQGIAHRNLSHLDLELLGLAPSEKFLIGFASESLLSHLESLQAFVRNRSKLSRYLTERGV